MNKLMKNCIILMINKHQNQYRPKNRTYSQICILKSHHTVINNHMKKSFKSLRLLIISKTYTRRSMKLLVNILNINHLSKPLMNLSKKKNILAQSIVYTVWYKMNKWNLSLKDKNLLKNLREVIKAQ